VNSHRTRFVAGPLFLLSLAGIAAALPPVIAPTENQPTEAKRVLGKILFFDEQMSTSGAVSCATCHVSNRAGTDPRLARTTGPDGIPNNADDVFGSPGVFNSDADNNYVPSPVFGLRPQITGRAANSAFNAAFAPALFWDGRATGRFVDPQTGQVVIQSGGALESQAVEPIVNTIEMSHAGQDFAGVADRLVHATPLNLATNHPADIAAALAGRPDYTELFERAFGDKEITATRIAFAIATYERTLISDQSPYDRFIAGQQNALTPQQRQGLQEMTIRRCTDCHAGDLFTDQSFRAVGIRPPSDDRGRAEITGDNNDRGKFKVPSLRNVGLKRSFFHNGQIQNLPDVIRFYARAPGAAPQFGDNQDPVMRLVNVPPQVAPLIQDFLTNGLTDPRVANQQFPFDRPTLFTERPQAQATIVQGTGAPGAGGVTPRIIINTPALVGYRDYRIGLDGARGGTTARLGISPIAPVNGRITPSRFFDVQLVSGSGNGAGYATLHWPLMPTEVFNGQVLFAQWFVDDAAAANGLALSGVARIPFFCGSAGCPTSCGAPDFNADGFVDFFDFDDFTEAFQLGDARADFNADGFIDFFDFDDFTSAFEGGC
jgi:cytochrome c peroxidase